MSQKLEENILSDYCLRCLVKLMLTWDTAFVTKDRDNC